MKAGDLVYESDALPETRGELCEFLCFCIDAALGGDDTDRMSNGLVADTLLRFLDLAVTQDDQMERLKAFLADPDADWDDDFV